MIVVPLHVEGQPCHNCGQRSSSLTVNIQYPGADGRMLRANRVNPCGCLLAVAAVAEGLDSREVRRAPKVRH